MSADSMNSVFGFIGILAVGCGIYCLYAYFNMKKDIHPEYRPVVFMDTTTGYKFLSGSTKYSNETVEFEGETYPLIRVEISSDSHPFYTGRQKFTQADGRVDRFNKKYGLK